MEKQGNDESRPVWELCNATSTAGAKEMATVPKCEMSLSFPNNN